MKFIYRIKRGLLSLYSNFVNKMVMSFSGINYGNGFHSCGTILFRKYGGTLTIGDCVGINSHLIADPIGGQSKTILCVCDGASLRIGNNVGISNACIFAQNDIFIDDEAVIGAGVKIYDTDFHSPNPEYRHNGNTHVNTAPVHIGKRAFIGGHSIILKGVNIGDQAVIAAGSVVTKNIPENEIWGGNPAKYLKTITYENRSN